MKGIISAFMLFCCLSATLQGEEKKKITIAIMNIRANNTKESLARACEDIIAEKLFSSEIFVLMEKEQMDKIARGYGFSEFNSADPAQAAKLGKILKVEKMLVGSITFLESYKIDIRAVDVVSGKIDISVSKTVDSPVRIERALGEIAITIERHYLDYHRLSGKFDISAEVMYLSPFGQFSNVAKQGFGVQGSIAFNSPLQLPVDFYFFGGYYQFEPKVPSIEFINVFTSYVGVSHRFSIGRNINWMPTIGAGYLFFDVSRDNAGSNPGGIYNYEKSFYYNPCVVVRSPFDVFLFDRWYLVFTPQYVIFFDPKHVGQFAGFGLGLKMLF